MKKDSYYIFFSKLSNPLRISIVTSLIEKDKCVNELSKELKVEQSKLSHALSELRECNIINYIQKGKNRFYRISPTIKPIFLLIDEHSKHHCKNKCAFCK